MAIRAQVHGHAMDEKALDSEDGYRKLGMSMTGLLVLCMLIATVICAALGHERTPIALGAATGLTTVAGVFVRGRGLFEREAKTEEPPSGGRDRDRTCDPYDVNVVLFR